MNYIKAQKYLTMKRKLAFYWLIVFVTMRTPIFSHLKDKNDMFTACGEDMIFSKKRNLGVSSVSIILKIIIGCYLCRRCSAY